MRTQQRRSTGGEPQFGLGDVGAGYLANIEPIASLLELLSEDLNVTLIELEDRAIAQQVHIRGGRVQQYLLLSNAQRLAGGIDLAFRLPGAVGRLEAIEKGLCAGQAHGAREKLTGVSRRGEHAGYGKLLRGVLVIVAAQRSDADLGPISRQSLRHVLVDNAQRRTL